MPFQGSGKLLSKGESIVNLFLAIDNIEAVRRLGIGCPFLLRVINLREEITVITDQSEKKVWPLSADFDGSEWCVRVASDTGGGWEGSGADLFDAFRALRKEPESQGIRFLVSGARVNFWPTPMSSQAGGGRVVAHYKSAVLMVAQNLIGYISPRFVYRYIFSPASASKVGTVGEQDAYREEWMRRVE